MGQGTKVMRKIVLALTLATATGISATPLAAEETVQAQVLTCFGDIGAGSDWNSCLNTMFAPCAGEEIGSEAHLGCLTQQRADWRAAKIETETDVLKALSEQGMEDLSGLMMAWPSFVEDKCEAVAEWRADISRDAAYLGCQISELALMTNEMTACLEGRSTEEYCQLQEN